MMWLMDHVFKYTNFGLVSLIHGDFFIRQVRLSFFLFFINITLKVEGTLK